MGQSLAADWIEGCETQWEVLLFSNGSFLGSALGMRILTTLQGMLKSYCGECTTQVRGRVSAGDRIAEGKGPSLLLLTQEERKAAQS